MTVGLVGSGPAVAAVEAALADVDVDTHSVDADDLGDADLVVAVGQAGDTTLEVVNEQALDRGLRWIGVELGGVGGYPLVDAAVAGFAPETACYECLSGRVGANLDPQAEPAAAPPDTTARFAGAVAGRKAARYLDEGDDAAFGRVLEIPHADRAVLPLPNCTCAGETDRQVRLSTADRDLEESLTRAEQGLDDRVGVVQQVGEAESFPVPYYLARGSDTSGFSDVTAARDAAGVAAGWNAAFMKALGEGFERYCAGVYRTDEFVRGTPADLEDAVSPSAFVCNAESAGTTTISWVEGRNLHTDGDVMLPAEFVHYPPPSQRYRPPITTGLGLGNSGVEAVLSGLYEVIERDAAVLSWYSTFEPMGLDVADDGFATLVNRARAEDLAVTPLLLTQDVDVPVVAVAVHREEWPRFAIGSGADLDVAAAARSALAEALQNWMELRGMGPEDAAEESGAIGHFADFPESAATLVDPETTVPAATVGPDSVPAGEAELELVLDRLAAADLTAYAARTTTRDVERLGFEAVRAVVPAAQPLFFGEGYFGDRAESVPDDLGFEPRFDREHHPFP
ncbi:YcaO-like family protein [Halobacteriales archaeon Cl-PHB]